MYILLEACQHPGVLRIIYFLYILVEAAFNFIPIALVVALLFDFSKAVIANDEKAVKNTKIVIQRIIWAFLFFCIPWIVSLVMNTLESLGFDIGYQTCINNAKSGNFNYYDLLLQKEEEIMDLEKDARRLNGSSGSNDVKINAARMTIVASSMVDKAKGEVGKNNSNGTYGGNAGDAWCAHFVKWVLNGTSYDGFSPSTLYYNNQFKMQATACAGGYMYVSNANSNMDFYYSLAVAKRLNKSYYTPKKGDLIFFNWKGETKSWNGDVSTEANCRKIAMHVGIVDYVEGDTVYTVEGNSKNMVRENKYSLSSDSIVGYSSWY